MLFLYYRITADRTIVIIVTVMYDKTRRLLPFLLHNIFCTIYGIRIKALLAESVALAVAF